MYTFESSVFIECPLEEVFAYVTNPANNCEWQTGVTDCAWTSEGPPQVGSAMRMVRSVLGRRIEATIRVTSWDPPNCATSKAVAGPVPIDSTMQFKAHQGGTLFTMSGQAELRGVLRAMERAVGRQAEAQLRADLRALKALLERRGR